MWKDSAKPCRRRTSGASSAPAVSTSKTRPGPVAILRSTVMRSRPPRAPAAEAAAGRPCEEDDERDPWQDDGEEGDQGRTRGHHCLAEFRDRSLDGIEIDAARLRRDANIADVHAHRIGDRAQIDRKSTRLNSSHLVISYAVFCLKKK